MGRAGAMADWDPLLIGQLLGDHRVLVFDNRGRATTSNPSPEPVTVPVIVQDPARAGRCAAITTFDLMGWSVGGEIAQRVAVDAPDRVIKLVLCATSPGSANAHTPGHHDGVGGGRRRRDRGAGGADAAVSGARGRRHAHRRAAGPATVLRRPRLPRTVGAVGRGGQDREEAVGWGAAATTILVPLIIALFSLGLGRQGVAAMARSTRRTSPRGRALWRSRRCGSTGQARPPISLRSRGTGHRRTQPRTSSTRCARL
jgi:pimeloyl-ACP methyl ester carboxylesterase